MSSISNNYNLLITRLDEFIRKYYLNQIIRGLIVSLAFILFFFLVIDIVEYFLYLSTTWRKVLFFSFVLSSLGILFQGVVLPMMHYFRLGKIISHQQAATIIGTHFTAVADRLLNILQLKQQQSSSEVTDLVNASISQKIEKLKPVAFVSAINLTENRKYLKYLVPPFSILLVLLVSAPNILKEGTKRLVNSSVKFEKKAPFQFILTNGSTEVLQYEDFIVEMELNGNLLPEHAYIEIDGYQYRLDKKNNSAYSYKLINLQSDMKFNFYAGGFRSKEFELTVLAKPMIVSFEVELDYPNYTGKKDEELRNVGDLVVPEGTKINWRFQTQNTEEIKVAFGDTSFKAQQLGDQTFVVSRQLFQNDNYILKTSNEDVPEADSIVYGIFVVKDQFPSIKLEEHQDSTNRSYLYFLGEISDDYGLRNLYFKYNVESEDSVLKTIGQQSKSINIQRNSKFAQFNHYFNTGEIGLQPGDNITYYFEIWDNDGVNGSKFTRSDIRSYEMPTVEELDELTEKDNEDIKDELKASIDEAKELIEELRELQEKLLQKKNLAWEDKKAIEDILNKQQSLKEKIENLKEKNKQNVTRQEEYKDIKESIRSKQEKLQELFDELFDEEMKKLFEKMESMLEEMQKQEMMDQLEDIELTDEQLEKELDRMLELFKQLEFEQKATETVQKLEELAKEQEELSKETKEKTKSDEELTESQKEIEEKFESIKDDLKELGDLNQELNGQFPMEQVEQSQQQVDQQLGQSMENLQKGKNKKASESQQGASDEMQEMSDQLAGMLNQMQMDQMQLDMQVIRQLLENLVTLSFDQEGLMDKLDHTNTNNPEYVTLVQQQYKLIEDFETVEDSLYELSKRVFQLETFINKEVAEIKRNMQNGISHLEERKLPKGRVNQQFIMTGMNNLALMLSETMEQMQQQMANQMPGSQQCQKPGSKPGLPKLGQMQQQLNDQIKQMKEGMKPGSKPGKGQMSKEMAQMAAQQAAIREALQKMADQQGNESGKDGSGELKKLIDEMDKTETDLVNKQLTNEMMKRQMEIMTRLLEAERAEREREKEKDRKSDTATEIAKKNPPSLEEYLKKREADIDLYKTLPPSLKPYYKFLVEKYFINISF